MNGRGIAAAVVAVITGLLGITVVFGSWYTVDQGERGVLLRNGALIGTAEPGLGFKTPWIEDVVKISVQSRLVAFTGENSLATYSRDQQPAVVGLSVNFRIPPDQVSEVYANYGGIDGLLNRVLYPQVREETKTVFGRFNAVTAIQERGRLNIEVGEAIQQSVVGPIIVEGVQIEDITFSDAYEASIEQRMLAEVEVQKIRQNAEREKVQAEIVVTQAKAQADAVRAAAEAEAEAIRLRGDAEAQAIDARGKALRDNPALIDLVQAEKWDGVLPTTIPPSGTVPFLNLGGR